MASTIWKGRLNFGLVSIPIKLFRAARAEKIHMHKLHRETGSRVRQVFVPVSGVELPREQRQIETSASTMTGPELPKQSPTAVPPTPVKPDRTPAVDASIPSPAAEQGLSRNEIVAGFEYEKDRYVEFSPEELERLAPKNSADMEIVEFVSFDEVDPVYLETSYYLAPDVGGNKPYALLFEALKKSGYAAIGQFVMYRRDQIMILRPGKHGLIGHTMFYDDEVRKQDEYHTETELAGEKEMALALKLIEALAESFQPDKFKDQYQERLREAISKKVERQPAIRHDSVAAATPVVDIMAALRESLDKARKPVGSETRPSKTAKTKRTGSR